MKHALLWAIVVGCGGRTGLGTLIDDVSTHDASTDGHDNADGSQRCRDEVIATDANGATALAVDGDTVFWGTTDGSVQRHDSAGTSVLSTVKGPISSVAFDAANVYFTTLGILHRVPRAGGATVDVAINIGQVFALSVDSGTAFMIDYGSGTFDGRVLRIDSDGVVTPLATGLDVPTGLAIDAQNVYAAAKGALLKQMFVPGPLLVIPRAGGDFALRLDQLHNPSSVSLNGNQIVYLEQNSANGSYPGFLRSVPKQPGPVVTLATINNELALDVTADGKSAYWTAFATTHGSLNITPLDGSASKELAASSNKSLFGYVRSNATAIFWTINWQTGAPPADGASVRKLCK